MPRSVKATTASGTKTEVYAEAREGSVMLQFGRKHEPRYLQGSRGRSRSVSFDPKDAARLVEQIARAIAGALASKAHSSP